MASQKSKLAVQLLLWLVDSRSVLP